MLLGLLKNAYTVPIAIFVGCGLSVYTGYRIGDAVSTKRLLEEQQKVIDVKDNVISNLLKNDGADSDALNDINERVVRLQYDIDNANNTARANAEQVRRCNELLSESAGLLKEGSGLLKEVNRRLETFIDLNLKAR